VANSPATLVTTDDCTRAILGLAAATTSRQDAESLARSSITWHEIVKHQSSLDTAMHGAW
jgi:hypothetical protein